MTVQDPELREARLSALDPSFEPVMRMVLSETDLELERRGSTLRTYVVSTRRTEEEQREKVEAGRSKTMKSRHLLGFACDTDFCRLETPRVLVQGPKKGEAWDPEERAAWELLHEVGARYGLRNLGFGWDWYHLEAPDGWVSPLQPFDRPG